MKLFLTAEQANTLGLKEGEYSPVDVPRVPDAAAELLSRIHWQGGLTVSIDFGSEEIVTEYVIHPDGSREVTRQTRRKLGGES